MNTSIESVGTPSLGLDLDKGTTLADGGAENAGLLHSWLVLAAATLALMFLYVHSTSFAPFLSVVAADMNIDPGQAGQLFTARLFGDAFFYLLGGFAADRFGIRFVLVAGGLITTALMACVCFLGFSLNLLLLYYFLLGIPGGIIFPCIGQICGEWFPGRWHGLVSSIFLCGGVTIGYGLGPILGAVALELTNNWKQAVFSLSLFNVAVVIMSLAVVTKPKRKFFTPEPEIKLNAATAGRVKVSSLFFKPVTIIGILVMISVSGSYTALVNYIGTFVSEAPPLGLGRGEFAAGQVAFIFSVAALVGGLISGPIYDRVFKGRSRPQFLIGLPLQAAIALALLTVVQDSLPTFVLVMIASGLGSQLICPITLAIASKIYPEGTASTMIGLWWGVATWGTTLSVYVCGLTLEKTGTLDLAFTQMAALPLTGFLLVLFFWNERFLKVKV